MEFPFEVESVLPYEITILNGDYRILNAGRNARIYSSEKLTSIIDAMGEASYRAQGLSGPVTTSRKFRVSDHRLYVIRNSNSKYMIIGILKVGYKHLYIYDSNGKVHERTPLCVLDFYVHENKQRLGYGKQLFDTMLEYEKCVPQELAIDRPSNKCVAFLNKHYHLTAPIHQVNNFVVYHGFFNQTPVANKKTSAVSKETHQWSPWPVMTNKERRPFFEQNEIFLNEPAKPLPSENNAFANRQQSSLIGSVTIKSERQPSTSYLTSYSQHYNQPAFLREQYSTHHSVSNIPRSYSQVFDKTDNFQRTHSKSVISTNAPLPSIQSHRSVIDTFPNSRISPPFSSVYTFPSIIVPNNNWRQQQSSAWNLFGTNHIY